MCSTLPHGSQYSQSSEGGGSAQQIDYRLYTGILDGAVYSNPGGRALAEVDAVDEYRLFGEDPAESVLVAARLTVDASIGGYFSHVDSGRVRVTARVIDGGRYQETARTVASIPSNQLQFQVELPVMLRKGVPVPIGFRLTIEGTDNVQAHVSGRLNFFGLTAHAVRSCQGFYGGNGFVPSRPVSWGSLKLRYR